MIQPEFFDYVTILTLQSCYIGGETTFSATLAYSPIGVWAEWIDGTMQVIIGVLVLAVKKT